MRSEQTILVDMNNKNGQNCLNINLISFHQQVHKMPLYEGYSPPMASSTILGNNITTLVINAAKVLTIHLKGIFGPLTILFCPPSSQPLFQT